MADYSPAYGVVSISYSASSEVSITGLDFEPAAGIFWSNQRGDSSNYISGITGPVGASFGFATSTSSRRSVGFQAGYGGDKRGDGVMRNDCVLCFVDAYYGRIDLKSWNSDGATLIVDAALAASGSVNIYYILLPPGPNYSIVDHSIPNATGTQNITGAGFDPSCAITIGSLRTSWNTAGQVPSMSIMCVDEDENVWCGGMHKHFDATYNNGRATFWQVLDGYSIAWYDVYVYYHKYEDGNWSSWITDGMQLDWQTNNASGQLMSTLFMDYPSFAVGYAATVNTLNADVTVSGLDFAPDAVFLLSHSWNYQSNTKGSGTMNFGGFSSTTNRDTNLFALLDGCGNYYRGHCGTRIDAVQCTGNTSTWYGYSDIQSMESDGWVYNMDDPDGTLFWMKHAAFGPVPIELGGQAMIF